MDFSVINDLPSKGASIPKVVSIILAENGSLHHYPITKFLSSMDIKKAPFLTDFIEKEFGINQDDQLVLRSEDGKQLELSMNLEDFFQKDKTAYVYITKGQRQHAVQDEFEVIGAISLEKKWSESCMQFLPSIYENFLGSDMRDYLESEILGTYDNLLLLFSDVKNDLNFLREGLNKIGRQRDAERIAKKGLLNYNLEKKTHFDQILSQQETKIADFQQYINKFDSYVEKLSKQEVDPQLGDENARYLINYFDMEKLHKSKSLSEKNQEKIKQKALEIKEEIQQYDEQLQNIGDVLIDHSNEIQSPLQEQENLFAEVQDLNLQEFRNMIDSTKGNPSQIDLTNFVKKESETTIPRLKKIYEVLKDIRKKLEEYLKENAHKLKSLVSDIQNIRVLIKGRIHNKLKVFCALVAKHEEGIFNFEILEKFPNVYQQSLAEVKRRCAFKKDYMTMLGILESFGNTENRYRHEFLSVYQQFLPKAFCPFLSKSFPHIKVSNIKRVVDQDLNLSFNDAIQSFARPSSEGDILKLLKNLNDNLESKEGNNRKLEETLKNLKQENENLKQELQEKAMSVTNFRKLLGSAGFVNKMEDFIDSYKAKVLEKVENMEKKVQEIQDQKILRLKGLVESLRQESTKKDAELAERLKELEILREENKAKVAALDALLEDKEKQTKALTSKCESVSQKLDEIKKESIGLKEQNTLKEKEIARLTDQVKKFERKEADSQQTKEKLVEDLRKDIKTAETEIVSKEKLLSENQQKIAELNLDKENLENELQDARVQLSSTTQQKEKLQQKVKDLEAEHEVLRSLVRVAKENQDQKEKEIKAKERDIDVLKGNLDTIKKQKENLITEAKSASDSKMIYESKLKKEMESFRTTTANKEEEIAALKKHVLRIEAGMKEMEGSLSQKESDIINLKHILDAKIADIENLSQKVGDDLSKSLLDPTSNMLAEIGNEIISLYITLFGRQAFEKIQSQEHELGDLLREISKCIQESVIKIDDFGIGDKVVAIRMDETNFVVLKKGMEKQSICAIYKDPAHKFKNVKAIVGTIDDEVYEEDKIFKKFDAFRSVKLNDVEPILSFSLIKPIK